MMQQQTKLTNGIMNKVQPGDREAHNWYRFVLSFPPHLVREYLEKFGIDDSHCVLDPFCGTGTTLVECKKQGIKSVGIEAHPMTYFASTVKADWSPNPNELQAHAKAIAHTVLEELAKDHIEDTVWLERNILPQKIRKLDPEAEKLLLTGSISPLPLHKALVLLSAMESQRDEKFYNHERLALAQILASSVGNLRFGPEVGIGKIKDDAEVIGTWLNSISEMASDLRVLQTLNSTEVITYHADSRQPGHILMPGSIDAVFTSPPYPNEKDYTRTTRLESVLLGFIKTKADLRMVKQNLLRSNSRNVFANDTDDRWAEAYPDIVELAEQIERRRIELNKTSGFEKLYARVTKLFFGGMTRHLSDLRSVLRPGAILGYVVGDQASFLQIMIRTGQHIAQIAESLGYEVVSIDLFRERMATATRSSLREEIVVLRWPESKVKTYHNKEFKVQEDKQNYITDLFGEALSSTAKNGDNENDEEPEETDPEITPLSPNRQARYSRIAEHIFFKNYNDGDEKVDFEREDINSAADELKVKRIKNLGDLIYSFRYRNVFPRSVLAKAPEGKGWIFRSRGDGLYSFVAVDQELITIKPQNGLALTKVPDATPGIVAMYTQKDEQALLAKLRYNRLIDIFTGVTCYSLQNHLRTKVPGLGHVETDEIYIGVDKRGAHYVFPVQAKGGTDKLGIIQVEQDYALCAHRFPDHVKCRPIAAQFMNRRDSEVLALFEFEAAGDGMAKLTEKHYQLVPPSQLSRQELESYASRSLEF